MTGPELSRIHGFVIKSLGRVLQYQKDTMSMNYQIEAKIEKDNMRYLLCFSDIYEYQIKEFMRIPLQKADSEYLSQYLAKRLLEEKHKLCDSY